MLQKKINFSFLPRSKLRGISLIKKWRRQWKINLIQSTNPNWQNLYKTNRLMVSRIRGNDSTHNAIALMHNLCILQIYQDTQYNRK